METPATLDQKVIFRDLKMRTNHNHKLDCDRFIHIQPTPRQGIPESLAEKTIFKITTADKSHAPVHARIINSTRQSLMDLHEIFTLLSHGMEKNEFIDMVLHEMPGASAEIEMTVYYYAQVDPTSL